MADIPGYVNPRSLGNCEPNQALGMDVFFEQRLWDSFIAHKKTSVQNVRTWDAVYAAVLMRQHECKIGNHAPCRVRVYEHPQIMALCIGLAPKRAS